MIFERVYMGFIQFVSIGLGKESEMKLESGRSRFNRFKNGNESVKLGQKGAPGKDLRLREDWIEGELVKILGA